ncbi:MAG TPA: hypothetical protein VE975_07115 [Actinomycetota bacterium]|nr:hypothetical protein [Actinomycetota bacterium]
MNDDLAYRLYLHAKGLGEAMAKHNRAVAELLSLAEGNRNVLEAARGYARSDAAQAQAQPASDDVEDTPEAPALLALRLLEEAIEQLSAEAPPS